MIRTDELRDLGEKLQQGIVLTRLRLQSAAHSALRSRGARTLQVAEESFVRVSDMVQSAQRMQEFMNRVFNMGIHDLLGLRGPVADTVQGVGMELLIWRVKGVIDELGRLNAALDEEEKRHGKGTEKRAA